MERYYLSAYEVYLKFVRGTLTIERTTVNVNDDKKKIATMDKLTVDQGSLISSPTIVVRYQYNNHLGSASLELDEGANIISYEEYHPFGTTSYLKHNTNISQKRYKYVGKERDEETGLYYYGARYYGAWIARFVSVDPLQHKYPYYTPYQYAGNKPIIAIDIDGLESSNVVQQNENGQQQDSIENISPDKYFNQQVKFYFDKYGKNGNFNATANSENGIFTKGTITFNAGDDVIFTVEILPEKMILADLGKPNAGEQIIQNVRKMYQDGRKPLSGIIDKNTDFPKNLFESTFTDFYAQQKVAYFEIEGSKIRMSIYPDQWKDDNDIRLARSINGYNTTTKQLEFSIKVENDNKDASIFIQFYENKSLRDSVLKYMQNKETEIKFTYPKPYKR